MDDIVDKLCDFAEIVEKSRGAAVIVMLSGDIFVEAANEIERLRASRNRWREMALAYRLGTVEGDYLYEEMMGRG